MNVSASNSPSSNGSARRRPLRAGPCVAPQRTRCRAVLEHLGALVDADDGAALLPDELERDGGRPGRDVEHACRPGRRRSARRGTAASAGPGRTRAARVAVVARPERREERLSRPYRLDSMALARRPRADRGGCARAHGPVTAVLAAEPASGAAPLPRRARRRERAAGSCSTTTGRPVDARDERARHRVDRRDLRARRGARGRRRPRGAARRARAGADGRAAARDRGGRGGGARARAGARRAAARRLARVPRRRGRGDASRSSGRSARRRRRSRRRFAARPARWTSSWPRSSAATLLPPCASVAAWKVADSDSRSAATRRISCAGCASSPSSRPSRCRRRSASSSRR